MKSHLLIILLISNILCIDYTELNMNKVYNVETKDEEFNYFKFNLRHLNTILIVHFLYIITHCAI